MARVAHFVIVALAACSSPAATPDAATCDPAACAAAGQLCEANACVDPWTYGSPVWSTCADDPRATPETIAAKAAIYDARAIALHTTAATPWVLDVALATGVDPETA